MTEGSASAARAPAVVAIVVTTDPGPWFEETLQALAAQDYGNLSVLVLVAGGASDPTEVVASRLPEAFVRRLPESGGFAAAVDEALWMVEGASFFLLCHDDCAPSPDAVHLMVEESFRSNAGIVCPKLVHWDDPRALLHVGQGIDKTGAVVERVQDGEIDAGQHDAVRDVFVAPGGCTLVRGDLFRALGGYDAGIVAMGEDLDLSWRAHVAGARVVVAPSASARHLGLVAAGRRPPPPSDAPSLQALQRRHELAAVLTCYSWTHLVRVVPQAFLLALGELVVARLAGDRRRARAVVHAWRWNFARWRDLRRRRAALAAVRVVSDTEVRSLQVGGSARLSTYLSRLTHQGLEVAHGLQSSRPSDVASPERSVPQGAGAAGELTDSIGLGFVDDADFDALDDLGRRGRRARGTRPAGIFASRRSRFVAYLVAALVIVVGSRTLIGSSMPLVGQFAPFPSWTGLWHQFFSSWQPAGTGSHAPASPAFGFLALTGTLLFGRSGLLQQVAVFACFPLGAWGMSRLLRPFGSARGRFAATLAYLALPLAVDALGRGRWDGLVAYGATPWVVLLLARATGLEPFGHPTSTTVGAAAAATDVAATAPTIPTGTWRRGLGGRLLGIGALEAVAMSFAPAMVVVVLVVGLGLACGSLVAGDARRGARALVVASGGTLVAAVLCAPWVVSTVLAGRNALSVLGLAGDPASAPGWGGLLRMAVGPVGNSPLAWLLPGAAVSALLLARTARLAWAIRLWAIALPAWFLALVAVKGWAVPFAPSVDVLLAPAAVAVAGALGLGVAAFEADLVGYGFGWRQGLAALSVAALAIGVLPTVAAAAGGRWGLPSSGYAGAVGFPAGRNGSPGYRVLWLGDPQALPSGSWAIGPGLAYATSTDGTPTLLDLWTPASPGSAGQLAPALRIAMRGETVRLGQALTAARVRYVVAVAALAPRLPGSPSTSTYPLPSGLVAALARQAQLRTVPVSPSGLTVFENTAFDARARGPSVTLAGGGGVAGVLDPLGAALELLAWVVVAAALLGRRRWLDWWWVPVLRARRRRREPHARLAEVEALTSTAEGGQLERREGSVPEPVGALLAVSAVRPERSGGETGGDG
jgi:GT2 family glycosyltransferase